MRRGVRGSAGNHGRLLRTTALTTRFGERLAADQLTVEVNAGECFGLLGPNGAGKTTTCA